MKVREKSAIREIPKLNLFVNILYSLCTQSVGSCAEKNNKRKSFRFTLLAKI